MSSANVFATHKGWLYTTSYTDQYLTHMDQKQQLLKLTLVTITKEMFLLKLCFKHTYHDSQVLMIYSNQLLLPRTKIKAVRRTMCTAATCISNR